MDRYAAKYGASLEQCRQLFASSCHLKLKRCDEETVTAAAAPTKRPSNSTKTIGYCKVCGKTLSNKYNLTIHMRKHTGDNRYKCDHCSRSFWNKSSLGDHKKARARHNGRCPQERHVNTERRRPSGAWQCKICKKKMKYPDSYEPHLKIRHGITLTRSPSSKPRFQCEDCGKGFQRSWELSGHRTFQHGGAWQFTCVFCGKGFYRQGHYWEHLLSHTEEKPYLCKVKGCDASYRQLRSVKHHRQTVHGEKIKFNF